MDCPKCGTTVAAGAADCPGCGVVLAKAADAMDRAYLRRQTLSRQKVQAEPEPKSSSPLKALVVIALLAVCAFGAWQWYTDDTTSDLEKLAGEVKQGDGSAAPLDGGRTGLVTWRLAAKFGIALAIFALGYMKLKSSLSP